MSKPKLLITGAAGRVGTLLRPILLDDYELRLCDLAPIDNLREGEEALIGDLADPAIANAAIQGTVGVVHLAAAVAADIAFAATINPNYFAVLNLLEACREFGVRRFIFASSHHAVGLHPISEEPYTANADIAPDGFYGLSKAFGEAACSLYAHRFGIDCLVIRIGNADPQVVDGRRERLWISASDLVQMIRLGLEEQGEPFKVVYGISNCPQPLLKNDEAFERRYRPIDSSSRNHSETYRPFIQLTDEEGAGFVGGFFAKSLLPDPRKH
ncbi:NAD-dependent epimerase/dehydratase family protein [Pseudomonas auratipiscis]|uniref:NAD(P)-dependent oxidoreductase n=1 Tax=Pseudomonas auratipiscis TaxID=3115853 RepID=A0AB35WQC2_9PSED|nr:MULTISPECIES: NAD(P)-dependent oxidoreductase [unclassified Pseudomonas]MEE1865858.1 NAD(P)-dependent oxidoreductase [Pseudomonas sp. 120P]MEE1956973.1 NAD(P)-dependent oxidoreductase [Pseudomonas sp. 119P]